MGGENEKLGQKNGNESNDEKLKLHATPEGKAVDAILQKVGAPKVDPSRKKELIRLLSTVDMKDGHPEENPRVLNLVSDQLKDWGLTVVDVERSSLAIENDHDEAVAKVNERLRSANMPTQKYKSNVGIYGFEMSGGQGWMEYRKNALQGVIDMFENFMRTAGDEGGNIFSALFYLLMRKKSAMNEVAKNVKELGLEDSFSIVRENNSIVGVRENITDFKDGIFLDDLLRKGGTDSYLKNFDSVGAIQSAVNMVADVHQKSNRGIAELLGNDVMLKVKDGKIDGSRLTLPDMAYESHVAVEEQQAMDLLDFSFSVGSAGMQKGGEAEAKKYIEDALSAYPHANVKAAMKKMVSDGKPHPTVYNKARLGFDRVQKKDDAWKMIKSLVQSVR